MTLVKTALDLLPESIRDLVSNVDVLSEVDPNFAGLHSFTNANYGRQYKDVAHVTYPHHQLHRGRPNRKTTIFLPKENIEIKTIVHELGHVLDEKLKFSIDTKPITWYANTDRFESFAESFTAWVLPEGFEYDSARDRLFKEDKKTVVLLEKLAQ